MFILIDLDMVQMIFVKKEDEKKHILIFRDVIRIARDELKKK